MRIVFALVVALFSHFSFAYNNVHHHDSGSYPLRGALQTGTDTNGRPLFLCMGRLFNSNQPGKTWPGYGRCNVPYGGKEYVVDQFEVPDKRMFGPVYWSNRGGLALTVGRDTNGNPLFVCQAYFRGSQQPGKTWPGYNHCNISYAGQEIITDNYRILAKADAQRNYQGPRAELNNPNIHGHASQQTQQCLEGPFGDLACGFNCVRSVNAVACAASPDQQCVSDNFGHIACGYGCVKTPTRVACASRPNENCIVNGFNEIRCGRQCRLEGLNQIRCY
nr:DUF3421 domain-containing protein [Legionella jordanis]